MASMLQRVQRLARRSAQAAKFPSATASTTSARSSALLGAQPAQRFGGRSGSTMSAIAAVAAVAMATATASAAARCEESSAEGGYKENPVQHVAALLRLYDEIDRNMEVLANRMLEDLQKRVEREKSANDGQLSLSPQQLALQMSIEFETTLENVQDAVFRNNHVTKEQVREALQRLTKGELRGGGAKGKLTVEEAEAIEGYVKRLERLRWKVTGSREPIIPTQNKPLKKQAKPTIPVETVVEVMEKLVPTLTSEMETIVRDVRAAEPKLPSLQQRKRISDAYFKRSNELLTELLGARKLELEAFQAALIFYHDDPVFEKVLGRLSAEQQRRFAALGL